MESPLFQLSTFLAPGEQFHIARVNVTSAEDVLLHTHAYAEIILIEQGSGAHLVNGSRVELAPGDLIMMRPSDCHTYLPSGTQGLTLVNVAFPASTLDYFRSRYFSESDCYFWSREALPYRIRIPSDRARRISSRIEETMGCARSNLQLDSLLLFIFRQIEGEGKVPLSQEIPLWLSEAIRRYHSSDLFEQGVPGFVALCDRNADYVNRTVRRYFGKSLTELMNMLRLQYAATQLVITSMPIKEICMNCGFRNMGHFYRIFQEAYHQTPKGYRKIHQTIL